MGARPTQVVHLYKKPELGDFTRKLIETKDPEKGAVYITFTSDDHKRCMTNANNWVKNSKNRGWKLQYSHVIPDENAADQTRKVAYWLEPKTAEEIAQEAAEKPADDEGTPARRPLPHPVRGDKQHDFRVALLLDDYERLKVAAEKNQFERPDDFVRWAVAQFMDDQPFAESDEETDGEAE